MPIKQPNYLATRLEQQAAKGATLPNSINQKLNKLFAYTQELRTLLVDSLPSEILATLLVVDFDNQQLTLAVDSQTAANHLTYLKQPLVTLISKQSLTFDKLNDIKVIVMYTAHTGYQSLLTDANHTHSNLQNDEAQSVQDEAKNLSKNPVNTGLTPKTKQTITHTIEHVIMDEALKESLKKLLEE